MLFKKSIFILLFLMASSHIYGDVRISGYYRKNGTYVQPHYRSNPDGNFYNNWSTAGNVNPHTGEYGTKTTNSNQGITYIPSPPKDLNTPYTTSYLSNKKLTNQQYSFTDSTSSRNIEPAPTILTSQQPRKLNYTSHTSNLSQMDMLDLESRIRASQRLKNLGYTGDTSNLSHMDMLDLESRIRASQRLKNLGYSGDTSNLSHMDMLDLESRIRASQRLKNLGYSGDTSDLSHMDMLDLESKIRISRQ